MNSSVLMPVLRVPRSAENRLAVLPLTESGSGIRYDNQSDECLRPLIAASLPVIEAAQIRLIAQT